MANWCISYIRFYGSRKEIEILHNKIEEWTSKSYKETDFKNCWLGNVLYGAGLSKYIDTKLDKFIECRGYIEEIGDIEFNESSESTDTSTESSESTITSTESSDATITSTESTESTDTSKESENNDIIIDLNKSNDPAYRDSFDYCTDSAFNIITETAWIPMLVMWDKVIEALNLETVWFNCFAEESGCEIYSVYDPYNEIDTEYVVEEYFDGEDYDSIYIDVDNPLCTLVDLHKVNSEDIIFYGQKILNTDEKDLGIIIDKLENMEFKNENSYLRIHPIVRMDNIAY